jgi:hypothetical protein
MCPDRENRNSPQRQTHNLLTDEKEEEAPSADEQPLLRAVLHTETVKRKPGREKRSADHDWQLDPLGKRQAGTRRDHKFAHNAGCKAARIDQQEVEKGCGEALHLVGPLCFLPKLARGSASP